MRTDSSSSECTGRQDPTKHQHKVGWNSFCALRLRCRAQADSCRRRLSDIAASGVLPSNQRAMFAL